MSKKNLPAVIPQEKILNQIYNIRGQKVMLDIDLAILYKVENRALRQAVKRNLDLFPPDFMYTLSEAEVNSMVSQNVIPSKRHLGGSLPYVFTEAGIAMLSSVLKSQRARQMNIAIMRAFVAMRKMLLDNTELRLAIEELRKKTYKNTKSIEMVLQCLDGLIEKKPTLDKRRKIGYKVPKRK